MTSRKPGKMMKWADVASSNVAAIGFDEESQVLGARFKNGGVYHYANCTHTDYTAVVGAKSVGKALRTTVADKTFVRMPDKDQPLELEYRCVNGHDRCAGMLPGKDCPYCELRP